MLKNTFLFHLCKKIMRRPTQKEYGAYYANYINKVPKGNLATQLRRSFNESKIAFGEIDEEKGNYAYAEGKWTVKELLMHLIDTERVMAFRALAFMRGDSAEFPGFDQDVYVAQYKVEDRSIADLLKEWKAVRDNTLFLYKQCTEEQSKFIGMASGHPASPRALFCIIIGHTYHHLEVLKERY